MARGGKERRSAKRLRDAEGYISPRIIIITHTPIEPRLPDKQKAVPRRGGAGAEVILGVNFGTLLNWLGKKGSSVCACKPRQTEPQLAERPATREGSSEGREGFGGGRLSGRGPSRPQAADTVAARGGMGWMRKMGYLERRAFQRPSA